MLTKRPGEVLFVGTDEGSLVGEYQAPPRWQGRLADVRIWWGSVDGENLPGEMLSAAPKLERSAAVAGPQPPVPPKFGGLGTGCGLFIAQRKEVSEAFDWPVLIESCASVHREGSPALSPDGLVLAFVRQAPDAQLYFCARSSTWIEFGTPFRLAAPRRKTGGDEQVGEPQFVDDENLVFAVTDRATRQRTYFLARRAGFGFEPPREFPASGMLPKARLTADRLALRIVRLVHTGNWVANTNLGMRLAEGEHFCWLHQDDLWLPGRAAELKRLVQEWPEAVLFVQPVWYIDAAGKRVGRWNCPLPRRIGPVRQDILRARLMVQDFLAASAPAFKADAAASVGGMDERLWYSGDWDFWLKLTAMGSTVYDRQARVAFRLHRESQTSRRTRCREEMRKQHATVLSRHIASSPALDRRQERLARLARFSADLNVALMGGARRVGKEWTGLAMDFVRLGPVAWHAFFRDSRLVDRVVSRFRASLAGE